MNPVFTAALTLAGVLAAGAPLLWLTATAPTQHTVTESMQAETEEIYALIQFSGAPASIVLRHNGQTLAEYTAPTGSIETTLRLPAEATLEPEVEATWPETQPGAQAISLTLERAGHEPRSCTRWGEGIIHDIFTYTW